MILLGPANLVDNDIDLCGTLSWPQALHMGTFAAFISEKQ